MPFDDRQSAAVGIPPSPSALVEMMRRETRLTRGKVPDHIGEHHVRLGQNLLAGDEYLLRDRRYACHYRRGAGITFAIDDPAAQGELDLFLSGSVYAAVACINGLYPIHASAIATDGGVIAFTGAAGAGKSTTVAGLGRRGFPLFADDTLVLSMDHDPPLALPGHKRLKLWPDSLAMTGAAAQEMVSAAYPKYFATAGGSDLTEPQPLAGIVLLDVADEPVFEALSGGRRLAALADGHYTARFHQAVHQYGDAGYFAAVARLTSAVPVFRFARPLEPERFAQTLAFLADALNKTALS